MRFEQRKMFFNGDPVGFAEGLVMGTLGVSDHHDPDSRYSVELGIEGVVLDLTDDRDLLLLSYAIDSIGHSDLDLAYKKLMDEHGMKVVRLSESISQVMDRSAITGYVELAYHPLQ